MKKFRFQIFDRQHSLIETGEIKADDHWDAVAKLDQFRPTDGFPGGLHWCTLTNVSEKMQHRVFPDGAVTDKPMDVKWGN
ncbi:hypothetical protein FHS76_002008 [Ochrobactrum daejeonense]|uniref:Uncharacterized protein n=1 Tax=Brucella daejeonensis TaxID=659015 RepID=A0A7W9EL81_9HYPH|nr:hypothetical protein [Brucella daejeonensis]MBB5702133.1 hypothetical protein [Brucella daejeonensis]